MIEQLLFSPAAVRFVFFFHQIELIWSEFPGFSPGSTQLKERHFDLKIDFKVLEPYIFFIFKF